MNNQKCSNFCNAHCSCSDCPNIQADTFEDRFDLPASEIGLERIDCKDCWYNEKYCTCDDCLFQNSTYCQETQAQNRRHKIKIFRKETSE